MKGPPLDDETQADDAQEATEATAQEATTADAQEADATPHDLEAARKLRREANALRKRVEELEREKLSETERLQRDFEATTKERDDLAAQLRLIRAEAAARDAGAIYPDLVADKLPGDILDDSKALALAVKDLKTRYPSMFRNANGSADGGTGGDEGLTVGTPNELLRDLARLNRR